jgi:hypothetical protein
LTVNADPLTCRRRRGILLATARCLSLAVLLGNLLSFSSCAVSLTVPKEFVFPDLSGETRIPLATSLRVDPAYRNLTLPSCTWMPVCQGKARKVGEVTVEHFGGEIAMGDALYQGSAGMLESLFQSFAHADPLMAQWASLKGKVDVALHPRVLKVESGFDHGRGFGVFVARITIRWEVFSHDGRLIYSNIVIGEASEAAGPWEADREERLSALYTRALADQFVKARDDLYQSGWWRKQWWKE